MTDWAKVCGVAFGGVLPWDLEPWTGYLGSFFCQWCRQFGLFGFVGIFTDINPQFGAVEVINTENKVGGLVLSSIQPTASNRKLVETAIVTRMARKHRKIQELAIWPPFCALRTTVKQSKALFNERYTNPSGSPGTGTGKEQEQRRKYYIQAQAQEFQPYDHTG